MKTSGNKINDIFVLLFLIGRKWEFIFNKVLEKENVTLKQLFLLVSLVHEFDTPPSIKEIADRLFTSHQNIKTIALQLEKKGFVSLHKDERDKRMIRVLLSEKNDAFWNARQTEDFTSMTRLLDVLSRVEVGQLHEMFIKLEKNAQDIYKELTEKK